GIRDRNVTGVQTCALPICRDGSLRAMSEISEQEFRAEAAAFLEANAERRRDVKLGWGEGSDRVNLLAEKTPEEERAEVAAAKQRSEERRVGKEGREGWAEE